MRPPLRSTGPQAEPLRRTRRLPAGPRTAGDRWGRRSGSWTGQAGPAVDRATAAAADARRHAASAGGRTPGGPRRQPAAPPTRTRRPAAGRRRPDYLGRLRFARGRELALKDGAPSVVAACRAGRRFKSLPTRNGAAAAVLIQRAGRRPCRSREGVRDARVQTSRRLRPGASRARRGARLARGCGSGQGGVDRSACPPPAHHQDRAVEPAEVLTLNALSIDPDDSVAVAARKLIESGVGAAPVIDAEGRLQGMISEGDLPRRPVKPGLRFSANGSVAPPWSCVCTLSISAALALHATQTGLARLAARARRSEPRQRGHEGGPCHPGLDRQRPPW